MNRVTIALAAFAATLTHAQPAAAPDPADPKAFASTLRYESALRDYKGANAGKPDAWKAVNEGVAALGGHAGHLKDLERSAAPKAPPRESPAAPSPMPTPPAGAGHRH